MLTYITLDIAMLFVVAAVQVVWPQRLAWRPTVAVLIVLLLLTALFDSVIVGEHIVAYNHLKIIGQYIGKAPLEDFAYPVAAVFVVPYLWSHYARKD